MPWCWSIQCRLKTNLYRPKPAADTKSVDEQIDFDCEYACSDAVRDKICNNQYKLSEKKRI